MIAPARFTRIHSTSNLNGPAFLSPSKKPTALTSVDGERQGDLPRHLTPQRLHQHEAERHDDDRVKDLPNQSDGRRCGRPTRFRQAVVPVHPGHHVDPRNFQAISGDIRRASIPKGSISGNLLDGLLLPVVQRHPSSGLCQVQRHLE
jgi:hypothetical protein